MGNAFCVQRSAVRRQLPVYSRSVRRKNLSGGFFLVGMDGQDRQSLNAYYIKNCL